MIRESKPNSPKAQPALIMRLAVFALLAATVVLGAYLVRDRLTLANLSLYEGQLRSYQAQFPLAALAVAFCIYVTVTGLSLPGAAVLSLAMAWYFGFARALVLISFASTAGATIAFLLSRFFLRDLVQSKFGDRLQTFNEAWEREGPFYLFTLRLIPAAPFFVINLVMGLTPIRVWTFWWVSQIGMLPGTIAYVAVGSSFPTLKELADRDLSAIISWQMLAAFTLLGVTPLVVRRLVAWMRRKRASAADSE